MTKVPSSVAIGQIKIGSPLQSGVTASTKPTPYGQYFKAGSYIQSSSDSTTIGAEVKFYALGVTHP